MRQNRKAGSTQNRGSGSGRTRAKSALTRARSQSLNILRRQSRGAAQGRPRALTSPERSTPAQRQQRLDGLQGQIATAKNLPPKKASLFLRAAYALRQAILDLGTIQGKTADQNSLEGDPTENQDNRDQDPQAIEKVKKAERALAQLEQSLAGDLSEQESAGDSSQDRTSQDLASRDIASQESGSAIEKIKRKPPEELSPQELADGILEVQSNIEQGKLLLPQNAGPLLRALYAIKLALFNLANADPKLGFKDRDDLIQRIEAEFSSGRDIPDQLKRDLNNALSVLSDIEE